MTPTNRSLPLVALVIALGFYTPTLRGGGFAHHGAGPNLGQHPISNQFTIALLDAPVTHPRRTARLTVDRRAEEDANSAHRNSYRVTMSKNPKHAADALRKADLGVTRPTGPADVCLAQMQRVLCPILGNLPFVRDIAGQVAMWGNFSCPIAARRKSLK